MNIDSEEITKKVARFSGLIREGNWTEIGAEKLKTLLRRLAIDARDNLDEPARRGRKLSGRQAMAALDEIFRSLRAPARGRKRSRRIWEGEQLKPFEQTLVAAQGIDGAPTTSFAEFDAWVSIEVVRARVIARRRGLSLFDVFRETMLPLLKDWGDETAAERHEAITDLYRRGVETIGLSGKPTRTAIRRYLRLDSRSRRSGRGSIPSDLVEIKTDGTIRILFDRAFQKGLRILERKSRN